MKRHILYLLLLVPECVGMAAMGGLSDSASIVLSSGTGSRPPAPIIKLNAAMATDKAGAQNHSFPFKNHHISLTVFHADPAAEKEYLIQTRLDTSRSEWSAPASRHQFEFTDLPAGDYNFEARAINSAGIAGEVSRIVFSIRPPWYRTKWSYVGYSIGSLLIVLGCFRIRDRQIRKRHQVLERLVEVRTEELTKASAAKDEFLAAISHEIRNPINGIIGLAESIKAEGMDHDSQNKLGLLRQCAKHLCSLLDDILDFSRVQPDAFSLESKVLDIYELMDSVSALTAADCEKQGVPLEIAISPGVHRQLIGDPRRIRQILLNYVSNALKYSGRGKISLTVWRNKTLPGSMEIFFAVSDEGPGISLEEQARLFSRFQRCSPTQAGRVPGTGLGLSLCKVLAEKMGGRVWLKSEVGQGSCFYFSVTLATADHIPHPSPSTPPLSPSFKTALVIDDEEYNRIALSGLIETLGISAHSAAGEAAALALARHHDLDLVFIDYSIPGLNGPAIAKAIRALPNRSAQALIFATTGFSSSEKRAECLAAGMNAFLTKPVTAETLRLALRAGLPKTSVASYVSGPIPTDPLVNLRLLATKKGVSFISELSLYFTELNVEFQQLIAALQNEDPARASYYTHLLYGRCSFINERELEHTLRGIEASAAWGRWDDARSTAQAVQSKLSELQQRLFLENPAARSE